MNWSVSIKRSFPFINHLVTLTSSLIKNTALLSPVLTVLLHLSERGLKCVHGSEACGSIAAYIKNDLISDGNVFNLTGRPFSLAYLTKLLIFITICSNAWKYSHNRQIASADLVQRRSGTQSAGPKEQQGCLLSLPQILWPGHMLPCGARSWPQWPRIQRPAPERPWGLEAIFLLNAECFLNIEMLKMDKQPRNNKASPGAVPTSKMQPVGCHEGLGTASWHSFLLAELIVVSKCVLWPGLTETALQ